MRDLALVRAANPGPFTLEGTNTWVLGRGPCWVVDPGPELDAHVEAVRAEVQARGGAGGIALTHDHADHSEAIPALRRALGGVPVGAAGWNGADVRLADGDAFGPLTVLATPGHAPDHLAFVLQDMVCTGDAVLGHGSVFVAGQLGAYLDALARIEALDPAVLLPGHGPLVEGGAVHVRALIDHRMAREARLIAALEGGCRTVDELLDHAWSDAPAALRGAAALTLGAHLGKLADEGRLPDGVQRP